jgi:hypothetical protein
LFTWDNAKNPTEEKVYSFDWTRELGPGEVIQSCHAELVAGSAGGLTIMSDDQFSSPLTHVKVSGGTAGLTGAIKGYVVTDQGKYDDVGLLRITADVDPAQSDLDTLKADLTALRQARITALTGTQVKEVWRDGRRLVYNVASVNEISKAIHEYEDLIAIAEASAAGTNRGRYRALGLRFS